MKKSELTARVDTNMATTKSALQTVIDNLNKGQKQKIVKVAEVKELLDRYGVEYEE